MVMECPYCGQMHSEGTRFCPHTGQQLPGASEGVGRVRCAQCLSLIHI